MGLLEAIKKCISLGYILTIKRELGFVYIKVTTLKKTPKAETDSYLEDVIYHQCCQIIPEDNHLDHLDQVIEFCIAEVNKLVLKEREEKQLKADL